MGIYGRNIIVLMCSCFSLAQQVFGTSNVDVQLTNIPLSGEICENGGTYVGNIGIKFHVNGTYERMHRYTYLCPDGFSGAQCPVLYWSFDTLDNLTTMEGTEQVDFDPRVPGKINDAVNLSRSRQQWIDLGVHHGACMIDPETCGANGGAISMWMKLLTGYEGGFLTTMNQTGEYDSTGIGIWHIQNYIAYVITLRDGHFSALVRYHPGWFHSVINFIGPSDGEGFRVYHDGTNVHTDKTKKSSESGPNNGTIIIGRQYTDRNGKYLDIQMDELLIFNKALTVTEIRTLSKNSA